MLSLGLFKPALMLVLLYLLPYIESKVVTNGIETNLAADILSEVNTSTVLLTLPVRLALCKLAQHAQGDAKTELMSVLGFKNQEKLLSCHSRINEFLNPLTRMDVIILNQIFTNYTDEYTDTFLKSSFGVRVEKINYQHQNASINRINNMIASKTLQRVRNVIQTNDINNKTSLILVSAVYFKVTWEIPFNIKLTRMMKFRCFGGKISLVPMMNQVQMFLFLIDDGLGLRVINIKLASGGLSMMIVLPDDVGSFKYFLSNVITEPNFIKSIRKRMTMRFLKLSLPRFKYRTTIEWKDALKNLGLQNIFQNNNTGLDGALKSHIKKHLHVSEVRQKSFVEFDEMGVFRAKNEKSHSIYEDYEIMSDKHILSLDFTADKPFYFCISIHYDNSDFQKTEELLSGIYYGPE